MSSKGNKKAREELKRLYGDGCFIERAGIRYISPEEEQLMKKQIKGFKKLDRTITYHHIRPRRCGGKATVENGANIARYNHDWLEQLPPDQREKVNNKLKQFKMSFSIMQPTPKGLNIVEGRQIGLSFDFDDFISIPVYDIDEPTRVKYNRAKAKQQTQKIINESEYWER